MRILHAILTQGFFGSERYCIELALAQANAGHEVAILIQGGDSDCARAFRREIEVAKSAVRLIVMPAWLPNWLHRPFARRLLARLSPEIVHSHLNPAARRIGRQARRFGIPHVSTLLIRYDAREHADCDGLVAIARWQCRDVGPEFRGRLAHVPAWISPAFSARLSSVADGDVSALRRAISADSETVVFASIGRLAPEKGMEPLIGAFRVAFPRGGEPVRLLIVGEGDLHNSLSALAAPDRRIALLGSRDDLATIYRACDVFVSAALFEPFGLAIFEAMTAGCPVVLTRTEGPAEFVSDQRVAWVETGDLDGLAARLGEAAAAPRRRIAYDLPDLTVERARRDIDALYAEVRRPKTSQAG